MSEHKISVRVVFDGFAYIDAPDEKTAIDIITKSSVWKDCSFKFYCPKENTQLTTEPFGYIIRAEEKE